MVPHKRQFQAMVLASRQNPDVPKQSSLTRLTSKWFKIQTQGDSNIDILFSFRGLMSRVVELQKGTGDSENMSFEERADALNELFTEQLIPFFRDINAETIQAQVEE